MTRGCGRTSLGAILALALHGSFMPGMAAAAELDSSVQQQIRGATFEVVQLKPPEGDVVYERPLPMELMPYRQRTDAYRPIGTAFAIAPDRYVTAGHVIGWGAASQFGLPALRDEAGQVYAIAQIVKYSAREDFVVFTLREAPKKAQYLKAGPKPHLNDVVFSAGNALGEGLVIRDGVYTSDSPEEQDGKWNWLRFTAAASPGNSGGPLIDQHGRVVGVVLRKSPSENLNYALSIDQVLSAKDGVGSVLSRSAVRLPIMDTAETLEIAERFALPQNLPEFYKAWTNIIETAIQRGSAQLLAHNTAHVFPHGGGAERLLHTIERSPLPTLIHEGQNGTWTLGTTNSRTVQLEHNGFVDLNGQMVRMRAPDDVALSALYSDSKMQMDLMLKAYTLHRAIGTDRVRVTSLGKAKLESTYVDTYGRVWQSRVWAIPYEDSMLAVISLPTPEGFAGLYFKVQTGSLNLALREEQQLLDYVFVTLEGSLARWQSYLAQKGVQPKAFESFKLEIEGDRRMHFHSHRFDLEVTPQLMKLSNSSIMRLNFAFFRDHNAVVWDVAGLWMAEGPRSENSVLVWRSTEPSVELPEGFQTDWRKLKAHEFPYDATISNQSGATLISVTAPMALTDETKILYALKVGAEGAQSQDVIGRKLDMLQHSFKQLER
jgi:serine protease Do